MIKNLLMEELRKLRKERPHFTLQQLARQLGVSTKSIAKVITESTPRSSDIGKKLSERLQPQGLPEEFVEKTEYRFKDHISLEMSAIKQLLSVEGPLPSNDILERLQLTPENGLRALNSLIKLELITLDPETELYQASQGIVNQDITQKKQRTDFLQKVHERWRFALENSETAVSNRNMTLKLSEESAELVRAEMEFFLDRIQEISESEKQPKDVYNLAMGLFPISRPID